jgi:photosystem II stability/assembly factor-like uncharacterized protein
VTLYEIFFCDANTGYAAGTNGTIRKTTNGGTNWAGLTSGTTNDLYEVHFIMNNLGYVVGAGGTVRYTTNGGTNWIAQTSGTTQSLLDVRFSSTFLTNALTSIGNNGTIISTTNGGTNWNSQNSGTNNDLYEIHFSFPTVGYAAGQNGTILRTTNGGANWTQSVSGTNNTLRSIYFPIPSTGFSVGLNGTILKTTSGFVGIEPVNNSVPDKFSMAQNYPNPFNPVTKIRFEIPAGNSNENIVLTVYNALGKEVSTLVNGNLQTGVYEIDFDGSNLPSGVYFYKLTAGGFTDVKKMTLIK